MEPTIVAAMSDRHQFDDEIRAFIERTEGFYPDSSTNLTVDQQRSNYDALCQAFDYGYPDGVSSRDSSVSGRNGSIKIRSYRLDDHAARATVVYLHGGGWVVGGLESHDSICAEICAATGVEVHAVDYRLAPEFTYPVHFEDALDAYLACWRAPTMIVGDSAGANLAAAVCIQLRGEESRPIGQVLIYPALGGETLELASYTECAKAPLLNRGDIEFYDRIRSGGKAPHHDPLYFPLSLQDYTGLTPCAAFAADVDPLRDDCEVYIRRLKDAGVPAVLHKEKGLVHGYLRARHSSARAGDSFRRICEAISGFGN